jgi:predicted methyltransferase
LSKIDAILWSLRDGKGHSLTEIIEKSPLPNPLMKMALSFLREFNFIQIDENEQKVKLHPVMLKFIYEIQRIEKEEASSHKSFESTVGFNEFASLNRSFKRI